MFIMTSINGDADDDVIMLNKLPYMRIWGVAHRLVFCDSSGDCEQRYHLNKQSHSMKAHQNHNSCCTQCERKEAPLIQFEINLST